MFEFQPISKFNADNFDILFNKVPIGTLYWKRNHPRPEDKVAIIHDLNGNVAIVQNEKQAIEKIVKWNQPEQIKEFMNEQYFSQHWCGDLGIN